MATKKSAPARSGRANNVPPTVAAFGRRDGTSGPGRRPTLGVYVRLDTELKEWFQDRAAILGGIPYTMLIRDVLATWRELVVADEKARGIDLEFSDSEIIIPERVPGYGDSLAPRGRDASHLDSTPLTANEELEWQTR